MLKLFDGAMGTQLQALGIAEKPCPEYASVIAPDDVTGIHETYVAAGADIIETNTFGANRIKLAHFGLEKEVEKIVLASVQAARAACGKDTLVAGAAGPTGRLIQPLGDISFDEVCSAYEEQVKALAKGGVDYILFETIIDIQEMRAAVLAAKAVCDIPIIAQLAFDAGGRTVTGTDAATAAAILEPLGVSVIGANCSLGPEQLLPIIKEMAQATTLPISVQPNAGLPVLENGRTVFPQGPEELALWVPKLVEAGAVFVGGCCGTTPGHIAAMGAALKRCTPAVRAGLPRGVRLASRSQSVWLGQDHPTVLIGERINPTGRKAMAEEIKKGSMVSVKRDALEQVEAGAAVLDINMGVPGIDQKELMEKAVSDLSSIVAVPFSIDSTQPAVIEAGLRYYPGRALINSVSGKDPEPVLALAKKYGAAVIVLPLGEKGLPATVQEKVALAAGIIEKAKAAGLSDNDIVLDALVLTAASDGKAPGETLKTLRLYREQFGYPTTMGLSNVSFGLPRRELVNAAFFLMALDSGLDAPIINPSAKHIKELLAAASVINGKDNQGVRYSEYYAAQAQESAQSDNQVQGDVLAALTKAVLRGEKEQAGELALAARAAGHRVADIATDTLTRAMNEVGERFAAGKAFLPQVLMSAEAMRAAFDALKSAMNENEKLESAGKIMLATVEGDIHDLGKNIVATLMENSGFTVIDLGKDVPAAEIAEAAKREHPDIVGLCALMTTTLGAMEESIKALRNGGYGGGIMVGGAVLTENYAQELKADMYAKDGVAAVKLAKGWREKQ